jgi:pantoate--beta-alanine ligase
MKIIRSVSSMSGLSTSLKSKGLMIGFVPTMGCLHEGHLSLVTRSKADCDITVVSIFVNPIQFAPLEDLKTYPSDLKRDIAMLSRLGVNYVFVPEAKEIYPAGFSTFVEVAGLSDALCGKSRPGHFRGVATIVAKLFNIVRPDAAFFGMKDYQQLMVIKKMASDLNMGVKIIGLPTVRERDGLAMSSRNKYLTAGERRSASALYGSLTSARDEIERGERDTKKLVAMIKREIFSAIPKVRIDYVEIRDSKSLAPIRVINGKILIALAVKVGNARLIDNILVNA